MKRTPLTLSESERLRRELARYETVIIDLEKEIHAISSSGAAQSSAAVIDGDDGYPLDWQRISLDYRRKVRFICEDCGAHAPNGHVHHELPVLRGGGSHEDNLTFLCPTCHAKRHPHMKDEDAFR